MDGKIKVSAGVTVTDELLSQIVKSNPELLTVEKTANGYQVIMNDTLGFNLIPDPDGKWFIEFANDPPSCFGAGTLYCLLSYTKGY